MNEYILAFILLWVFVMSLYMYKSQKEIGLIIKAIDKITEDK